MERLEQSKEFYNELWNEYVRLGDVLTGADSFMMTILTRANALNEAFCELIRHEEDNRIAIVPLLRLQMDNLLYCYAGTLCEDFTVFMRCFMFGEKWTTLTDREGHQLTEGYLVGKLCDAFQNNLVKELYDVCSEFIHLSNHHLYITLSLSETGILQQTVGSYKDVDEHTDITSIMILLNHLIISIVTGSYFRVRKDEMLELNMLREKFPEKSDKELLDEHAFNADDEYERNFFAHLRKKQ